MHGQYHDLLRLFEYGGFPPVPRHFFSSPYVYHRLSIGSFTMFCIFLFPKQFTVGVLSSFLRGVRPCVTGLVRLYWAVSASLGLRLYLSPFICLPSCVSLSGGVRLSGLVCALSPFSCLPSCVSLSGGVRLSGLVCALSPFMCLPEWWCLPRRSCLCLVSLQLSPFMCLAEWWCPPSPVLSVPCLPSVVSLHVSR